jgi:hypothetical protein
LASDLCIEATLGQDPRSSVATLSRDVAEIGTEADFELYSIRKKYKTWAAEIR